MPLCLALCLALSLTVGLALAPFAADAQRATPPRGEQLDSIAVVVGEDVITRRELQKEVQVIVNEYRAREKEMPPIGALEAQIVEKLINDKLQLQEARRLGIQIDELALDRSMENLARKNNMSLEELRRASEKEGLSYADLRARVRTQVINQRLIQQIVINNIDVSDEEIDAEIRKLGIDVRREYRLIRVRHNADALKEARPILEDAGEPGVQHIRRVLRKHQKQTERTTPYQTQLLGWRDADELPRVVREQLDTMAVGSVSRIVKNKRGAQLYILADVREDMPGLDGENQPKEVMPKERLYEARHILIRTNVIDDAESVSRRLARMRRDIESGKRTFAELAERYSDDPISSFKGGSLGWVSDKTMVAEFAEQLRNAPVGEIVGPFVSPYGGHLLEVTGHRESSGDMSSLRARIESEIRRRKSPGEIRQWQVDLRNTHHVEIRLGDRRRSNREDAL